MRWILLVPAVVLPALAAVLTRRPALARLPRSAEGLTAYQLAWLRNGPRAFAVTTVVALHLAGLVERLPDGRLARSAVADSPADPLLAGLLPTFGTPVELERLASRGEARQALRGIRAVLVERGLFLPVGRAVLAGLLLLVAVPFAVVGLLDLSPVLAGAGGTVLAVAALRLFARAQDAPLSARHSKLLRAGHPLPDDPAGASRDGIVRAVAVHGRAALDLYLPGITGPAELLWRRPVRRSGGGDGPDTGGDARLGYDGGAGADFS
ncbi:hypothetical protein [Kitasatospora sp. NPDC088346]|uniref:hypothetical protein n=1 Tax=Kitasatospora sp. NPDC088346 TaxID=3364073 RepID=UPI0037FA53F7